MRQTAGAAAADDDDDDDDDNNDDGNNEEAAEVHGKVGDGGGRHCNDAKKS